jgi:hypothetical protein
MTNAAAPDTTAVTCALKGVLRQDRGRLVAVLIGKARFGF